MGIADTVDLRLTELRAKRDELRARLDAAAGGGTDWVARVVRVFELGLLLREAILYGSRPTREMALTAVASNLSVDGKNLILTLKTSFRERAEGGGRLQWCSALDDVRTETEETLFGLEQAYSIIHGMEVFRSLT